VFVGRGICRAVVDFDVVECRAGSLLTVKPGQVHRFGLETRWDALILLFRPHMLQASQAQEQFSTSQLVDAIPTHLNLGPPVRRPILAALGRMRQDCTSDVPRPLLNVLLHGELAALVTRLHILQSQRQSLSETAFDASERFREFKRLVDVNHSHWHHVSRYAQAMGCSEKTLTRICTAAAGTGAKGLIAARLALEAKRMLAHTKAPVIEIAEHLGFDDSSNFTKFFRGVEGCTPGDFRRHMGRGNQLP
jgi:AraC-like DNA-binding protein